MSDPRNYLDDESMWEEYDALSYEAKAFCLIVCHNAHKAGFDLAVSRITNEATKLKFEYRSDRDV